MTDSINPNPSADTVDRRGFLKCMAWVGTGVLWTVRGGMLSLEEACERYKLTVDEFLSWQRSIDKHGLPGLRATRLQDYRN